MQNLNILLIIVSTIVLANCSAIKDLKIVQDIESMKEESKWASIGIKPSEIVQWKNDSVADVGTPEKAKKWIDAGIDTDFKKDQWTIFADVKNLNDIIKWKKAGFTYSDVNFLKVRNPNANIDDAIAQKKWNNTSYHFSLDDISDWRKAGINSSKEALTWINAGFDDGYEWKISGYQKPSDALPMKKYGIEATYLKSLKLSGFNSLQQIKKVCSEIVDPKVFGFESPYKNIGKCSTLCIKTTQVLSKNSVFGYKWNGEKRKSNDRVIVATANNDLLDHFSVNSVACGLYKITGTKSFNLLNRRTVIGNKIKRLSGNLGL